MKKTYDVSDRPSQDFFASPDIRVGELVFVRHDTDASYSNPTPGGRSGWMPNGLVEGRIAVGIRQIRNDVGVSAVVADSRVIDVAKVSVLQRETEGGPRVHSKKYLNSIPEAPRTRIVETERVVCAPVV